MTEIKRERIYINKPTYILIADLLGALMSFDTEIETYEYERIIGKKKVLDMLKDENTMNHFKKNYGDVTNAYIHIKGEANPETFKAIKNSQLISNVLDFLDYQICRKAPSYWEYVKDFLSGIRLKQKEKNLKRKYHNGFLLA